jgi:hypothetical protein
LNQLLRGNPAAAVAGDGFGFSKSTPAFMKLSSTPMDIKVSRTIGRPHAPVALQALMSTTQTHFWCRLQPRCCLVPQLLPQAET